MQKVYQTGNLSPEQAVILTFICMVIINKSMLRSSTLCILELSGEPGLLHCLQEDTKCTNKLPAVCKHILTCNFYMFQVLTNVSLLENLYLDLM